MDHKISKLNQQFHDQSSNETPNLLNEEQATNVDAPPSKEIFSGVTIFVNGYTIPSHQELKILMATYGGKFMNYYSRSHVTHVVCSHLPNSKVQQTPFAYPIVQPKWVTDSIKASKLLP
eukprot:gene3967-4938_t